MIVLSNGYKLPEDGDLGDIWFDALEDNIQRLNDHKHNGIDSEKLPASAVEAISDTIDSGDFNLVGDQYEVTITLPSLIQVDTSNITFRDATTREPIYLKFEFVSITQIKVFTNTPVSVLVVIS